MRGGSKVDVLSIFRVRVVLVGALHRARSGLRQRPPRRRSLDWGHYRIDGRHGEALIGNVIAAGLDNPSDACSWAEGPASPSSKGRSPSFVSVSALSPRRALPSTNCIPENLRGRNLGILLDAYHRANATPVPCRARALPKNPKHAENDFRKPARWEFRVQLRLLSRHVPLLDWPPFDASLDSIDAFLHADF